MDLNHIILSSRAVADLYPSSLIDNEMTPAKVQPVLPAGEKKTGTGKNPVILPDDGWNYLGENRKNILIVIRDHSNTQIGGGQLKFLEAMLGACKLVLEDVAIINLERYTGAGYKEFVSYFKSRIVLLFDTGPADFGLPMEFPHFQLQPFSNCTFLYIPSIKELEEDKVLKSKLWVCLRRLFGI